eukprot:TRINITY_DN57752_c0_g1_i1.p1 TRINITY_DN57752_c0_g1~~TRINITY_DN57752_c0_g1_i1.p1  ORF type:complete len:628 (-),score=106.51 TRINITY_DN57752_c0_g1_i1:115-1998(-)
MRSGLLPSPRRTSTASALRSRCAERNFDGCETIPVKLIVFDFDETLTLMTYLIEEGDSYEVQQQIVRTNFETPWVKGSRISKLKSMLTDLSLDALGQRRALAILTKNSAGAAAVLRLLQASNLAEHFDAIWTMPWRNHMDNAMYQQDGEWKGFDPPVAMDVTNKAELLSQVPSNLEAWLPQLEEDSEHGLKAVAKLTLESILLVDDQRANFQSASGAQIFRYCKVARYDAQYRNIGFVKNMGGIGAHCEEDYNTLKSFVESPSSCKETLQLHCVERYFAGSKLQSPVGLVVFDFDETLTLATFMPDDDNAFLHSLNWQPEELRSAEWTVADLATYNFESPYVGGSRIEKLKHLLSILIGEGAQHRKLAILSWSDVGAVAIVNLLKLVGLAEFFSAVWTRPHSSLACCGAYQKDTEWQSFDPPAGELPDHKADVLHHLISHPAEWFPQLLQPDHDGYESLLQLKPQGVVLVDDERASFQSSHESGAKVLRYCKVARYDEAYRNCGALNQMGGIGAHSDRDYDTLRAFVERPWDFSQDPGAPESPELQPEGANAEALRRIPSISEELRKMPRKKKARSSSSPALRVSPAPGDGLRHQRNNSFSASPTFTFQLDEPEGLDAEFDLVLSES